MNLKTRETIQEAAPGRRVGRPTVRLLGRYTILFAVFCCATLSPFWLYGRAFLWRSDGMSQHLPTLTYCRYWIGQIVSNLLKGKVEIPYWTMWLGFGQNTISNPINFRLSNLLYALFPYDSLEFYLAFRSIASLYLTGLAFIAYGRTRVRDQVSLLTGSMIYTFSAFCLYFAARHAFFLEMTFSFPLLLLGVDRIFEGKWSWTFVLVVAMEGLSNFYFLFMITLPAVIYALFHFFELDSDTRKACGGFGRILLRHVVQFLIGALLAAPGLLPTIEGIFRSSRGTDRNMTSYLHWNLTEYREFLLGIVDTQQVGQYGFIALPSAALISVICLAVRRGRDKRIYSGHLLLYTVAYLVPLLTMLFSGFAGKTLRWSYLFAFWTALVTALMLPELRKSGGPGLLAICAYAGVYLLICVYLARDISLSIVLTLVGFILFYHVIASGWGQKHRRAATVMLLALLLIELTTKSYEMYSPQYDNYIASFVQGGTLLEYAKDNPSQALDMVEDEGAYRTDVIITPRTTKYAQMNYGLRNHVNGLSSYYSFSDARIVSTSLELGNSQQNSPFLILDWDQRAVLDELSGVKYAAAFTDSATRVPFGYYSIGERERTLSDGTTVTEKLYRNNYALSLSYAYDAYIPRDVYDSLPPNRKEEAMLQGVLLEEEVPLKQAELTFDDQVLLDNDALWEALESVAAQSDYLDIADGALQVKQSNYSVSIPIERARGEILFQLEGVVYRGVDYHTEQADRLTEAGASKLDVMAARRAARKWTPAVSTLITVTAGALSDDGELLGPEGQYYFGKRDMLFNLGYGTAEGKLTIKFSQSGEYRFDRAELIVQPMDSYAQKVAPLQERQAKSVEIDGNTVTVEYDLEQPGLACLAIPCSDDWHATVDGEEAKILQANGMYMGVMIGEGPHTIVFRYRSRSFVLGVVISLVTLNVTLIALILQRRRRRKGE